MKRNERVSEEYDEYEPEIRIWPYILLAFLIPGLPFLLRSILSGGAKIKDVFTLVVGILPLLMTTYILRNGDKEWLLLTSGGAYLIFQIVLFASGNLPEYLPFSLSFSPCILSLLAYSFYQKRKRKAYIGTLLLSILFSAISILLSIRYSENKVYNVIFPSVLFLFALFIFPVTRRTESTPWYITLILSLTLVSSLIFQEDIYSFFFDHTFEGFKSIVSSIINVFVYGDVFWYTLSFFFVFASLSGKSSYKKVVDEGVEEEEVVVTNNPIEEDNQDNREIRTDDRYTYPPDYSRFDNNSNEKVETPKTETTSTIQEKPRRNKRDDDDRWLESIERSVKKDDRRRDDDDYYYDERRYLPPKQDDRRRDERDRRYYDDDYDTPRPRRYSDRRYDDDRYDERRYDDRRYPSQGRRYDDRYDDRRRRRDDYDD